MSVISNPLVLRIKRKYFDEIRDGVKNVEYRTMSEYWDKRIIGKRFSHVLLIAGYQKNSPRLERGIEYIQTETMTHEHFGNIPTKVYAIHLKPL